MPSNYNTRFFFRFETDAHREMRINIQQRGYSGAAVQRAMGETPVLKRDSGNNGIFGTSLEIVAECNSDNEYAVLYTSDPREFYVELIDVDRNVTLWDGFVSPELYSAPEVYPPYDVRIIAVDGLGELKRDNFVNPGRTSILNHLISILSHSGLQTNASNILIIDSLSCQTPYVPSASLMSSIQVDLGNLTEQEMTCYEALEAILATLNLTITRYGSKWLLVRESDVEVEAGTITAKTAAGETVVLPVIDYGSAANHDWWPVGRVENEVVPARNRVSVSLAYARRTMFENADLVNGNGWIYPTRDDSQLAYVEWQQLADGMRPHLVIADNNASVTIRQEIPVQQYSGKLTLRIQTLMYYNGLPRYPVYFRLAVSDGTALRFLKYHENGNYCEWVSQSIENKYEEQIAAGYVNNASSVPLSAFSSKEIEIPGIPLSGTLGIFITAKPTYALASNDFFLGGVYLSQDAVPGYKDTIVIDNGARGSAGDVVSVFGDAPYTPNGLKNVLNVTADGNGVITTDWQTSKFGGELLSVIAMDRALGVALPRLLSKGVLNVPSDAGLPAVIVNPDGIPMLIQRSSWKLLDDEVEVEILSVPSGSVEITSESIVPISEDQAEAITGGTAGTAGGGGTPSTPPPDEKLFEAIYGNGGITGAKALYDIFIKQVEADEEQQIEEQLKNATEILKHLFYEQNDGLSYLYSDISFLTDDIAAHLSARIMSLEDWLRNPSLDELCLDYIGVSKRLNVGGMEVEYDADNNAWHLIGNFYADGWISAGGVNSSGGGGGGVDIGAVWQTLTNDPSFRTEDYTSTTKIALAHIPISAGDGIAISNAGQISLASTGVAAGTYTKVTVDVYGRVLSGQSEESSDIDAVFAEAIAGLYARVSSLEDWLRNPWFDELNATALNAQTVDVGTLLTVDGAANIAGMLTASGELKVTGTSKKIWLGDNIFIELDTNGYIHTNGAFYSDSFISAGGLGTGGGGGGGVTLLDVWTSLCNTTVTSVDANTKIAVDHIPDITTGMVSDMDTWWTNKKSSLGLGAAATYSIGTVTDGSNGLVTGDMVYDFVMATAATADIESVFAEGIATVSARVGSLEDWLRDPALDTLQVADLCAAVATVTRIYIGDAYFEYDADGYLHTNAPLYSDEWISAGGVGAGGGSGTVDLGAVWTSLCNESIATADITPTTKIALAHLPYIAGDGIAIISSGETARIALSSTGVQAGTYAAVTVDVYGRVISGSAPAALTFGNKSYNGTQAQTLTAADLGALTAHQPIYTLTINNSGGSSVLSWNPATANGNLTLSKAMVGLGNVENIALSYWTGSTFIKTVGTITSGTWHGSAIGNAYLEYSSIGIAGTAVSLGGNLTASQLRSLLSINNVENTALSTWVGSTYINTVGTITTGTWHGSRIENGYLVHNKVTIAGVDVSLGGSIADYTLLSALGLTSAASDISTLSSYFTDGVANQATRLSGSYTRSAWGQTFWSNGQPASISGAMTGVDSINGFLFITNSNGRLGVGTSQPSSTLHVAGGAYITSSIITDSYIYIGGTSAYIRNDGGYLHTNVGFAADGFISAGGVSSSSDARLKKNLKDIALTVHDIAAAPAVSFDWVDDRGSSAGSIAQYWQPLLPDNVRAWEVDGFLSMEYGNIALLAAITIARAVETQEQKIARLEARVQELENQLLKH